MIIQRQSDQEIRPDQVRAMARGLYHLAGIDGMEENEKELIRAFLREGKVELDLDALAKIPFSLEELTFTLDTVFLRKLFLKICVLLSKADGMISEQEMLSLRRIAQAMGVAEPLDSIVDEVEGKSLR